MITWIKPLNYPKMQIIGYWIGHCLPSNYKFSMEIATGKVVGVRDTMVTSILKLEIRTVMTSSDKFSRLFINSKYIHNSKETRRSHSIALWHFRFWCVFPKLYWYLALPSHTHKYFSPTNALFIDFIKKN